MTARTAISLSTLVAVAAVWYVATSVTGWVGPARFPNPAEFAEAVRQIALTGYGDARIHQHVHLRENRSRSGSPAPLPFP